jgi:glycosyltransferase involved in cell wall biosynthesis
LPTTLFRLVLAHVFLLVRFPIAHLGTLWFLLTRPHPGWKARFKTMLHFGEAGLAAYHLRHRRHGHIHSHFLDRATTIALAVGRILDIPYSVTAHANDIYVDPILLPEKLGQSEFVVTVSRFNKAHLLSQVPDVDDNDIVVLHPWVDVEEIRPAHRPHGIRSFEIVSVGRLVEKKGHRYLLEACGILAERGVDFECTIVGTGPLTHDLAALVESLDLGDRVRLTGALPHDEALELVSRADVFALACVLAADGDRDGIPVAIAEAMALEVPVVSTDLVGIGELVHPGAGLLVPPNDPHALAEAIERIARLDEAARAEMGRSARHVVTSEFDLRAGVKSLADLYAGSNR